MENHQIPCSHSKLQLAFSIGNPTETALLPMHRTRSETSYLVAAGLVVAAKIVGTTARDQCASGILALERRSWGYERHLEEHNPHLHTSTQNTLFRKRCVSKHSEGLDMKMSPADNSKTVSSTTSNHNHTRTFKLGHHAW